MSETPATTDPGLFTLLAELRSVGRRELEAFQRLRLRTVGDLLFFFPRDYQDLTDLRAISDLEEDRLQSVEATVEEIDQRVSFNGNTVVGVLVRQNADYLRAVWFNQPFMREKFARGQRVMLFGKPKLRGGRWEMSHPRWEILDEGGAAEPGLLPVYPLTEGLKQHSLRRAVQEALANFSELVCEALPRPLREQYQLVPITTALADVHFPADADALERARRRFIFQELLILQLALAQRRCAQCFGQQAPVLEATAKIGARIERLLPFQLTAGQRQVLAEITGDMARPAPMNRLLQGDVGSGKTVVATYAMMVCVAQQHQAVMMAPTELLARQHFETLTRMLRNSQVRIALLTGGLNAADRRTLLIDIAAGEVDIVVGTQAIVQSGAVFRKLGLVVIDEQHRFGVRQRAALKQAGLDPHYLVMTATPIPRTISMTVFGDLDVSSLKETPAGRQPVRTYLVGPDKEDRWWEFVRKKLREGRQAFVVAPLVGDSDKLQLANVSTTYEDLANGQLEAFRLDLVHGQRTSQEKQLAMEAFAAGRTQVLVCTSIVEVGINVPNATLMTILDAERFGLAQLHQLRGRVSRGTHPGYCAVQADPKSDTARQRLEAFTSSQDGFHLAEIDFQLRGPGDLFGTAQHGLPRLRIADLTRDGELLAEARAAAQQLVADNPELAGDQWTLVRRQLTSRYSKALDLGDVG